MEMWRCGDGSGKMMRKLGGLLDEGDMKCSLFQSVTQNVN